MRFHGALMLAYLRDPRAEALLTYFPLPPAFQAFAAVGRDLTGEAVNVDFALAALAAADDHVAERVRLLLAPQPVQRSLPVVLVLAGAVLSWAAAGAMTVWADNLIQIAERLYPHS